MLINPKLIDRIGLMREEYFLYYEDSDYCLRAERAGFKIYYVPESIIWHKNAGSTGGSGSRLQDYYITRNRLLFGNRFAPIRSKISLNREGIALILRGREWQKKGAKDYFFGKLGKSAHF
jgi:GT2 family glycosyltransferase